VKPNAEGQDQALETKAKPSTRFRLRSIPVWPQLKPTLQGWGQGWNFGPRTSLALRP